MDHRLVKYAAAGAITGLLGIGGATLASAQEDPAAGTSTTVVEEGDGDTAADPSAEREDCPEEHEASTDESSTSSS